MKRGRRRQSHAKRRTTTRQGRQTGFDPHDTGTDELKQKRLQATGSTQLSHEDPLDRLYAKGFLSTSQYNAGRDIGELLALVLPLHVGNIWQRLLTGIAASILDYGPSPAAERAAATLHRLALIIGNNSPVVFAACGGTWVNRPELISDGLERVARYWSSNRETNIGAS